MYYISIAGERDRDRSIGDETLEYKAKCNYFCEGRRQGRS